MENKRIDSKCESSRYQSKIVKEKVNLLETVSLSLDIVTRKVQDISKKKSSQLLSMVLEESTNALGVDVCSKIRYKHRIVLIT